MFPPTYLNKNIISFVQNNMCVKYLYRMDQNKNVKINIKIDI